jgi:hypothetical protein
VSGVMFLVGLILQAERATSGAQHPLQKACTGQRFRYQSANIMPPVAIPIERVIRLTRSPTTKNLLINNESL